MRRALALAVLLAWGSAHASPCEDATRQISSGLMDEAVKTTDLRTALLRGAAHNSDTDRVYREMAAEQGRWLELLKSQCRKGDQVRIPANVDWMAQHLCDVRQNSMRTSAGILCVRS